MRTGFAPIGPWTVFVGSLLIFLAFLGASPIYILDEARNSEAAREMLVSGNYLVPYFNGQLRTDKPPLHYFLMVLGYKIFGINSFGARFFSGVFGALTILITYLLVKQRKGKSEALIVVSTLLASLFFVQEFHLAVPDPYLIFFLTSSFFGFYEFYKSKKRKILYCAYIAIGFGILTKGPIALLLPGLCIPVFLLMKKDFTINTIRSFKPFLGILTILLITLPWYLSVHNATDGQWTKGFFFDHNISRFNVEKEGHGGPFFLTTLYVFLGLLPFSFFIPQSFSNAWKKRKQDDFLLFSMVISGVTTIFFSLASTKLPNYPMPCYPFIAVLIGNFLNTCYNDFSNRKYKSVGYSFYALLLVSSILPIAAFIGLGFEFQLTEVRWTAFTLFIVTISSWVGFYLLRKKKLKQAFLTVSGGWILMGLVLFGIVYPILCTKARFRWLPNI